MTKTLRFIALAIGAATLSTAAIAGEVNGSTTNPKDDFSRGVSFCKFSGRRTSTPATAATPTATRCRRNCSTASPGGRSPAHILDSLDRRSS
jgi:hypothetical protein